MKNLTSKIILSFLWAVSLVAADGRASVVSEDVRIKDLVNIRGVRANQLLGFGLVIGLRGTGDSKKALTTNRAAANMLTRLGMNTAATEVVTGNLAAVVVTAELPGFAKIGDRLDVTVSAVGDAKSLAGGTLILTPLKAGDSNVYGVAQGPVVVGDASGQGSQVLTVARVPQGATVEREFSPDFAADGNITLSLRHPDFTTAGRIAEKINERFKGFFARANNPSEIVVTIPILYQEKVVELITKIEALRVKTDQKAVVVINERTGTVVMGQDVVIMPITISHGDLTIEIEGKSKKDSKEQTVVNFEGTTVGQLIETMNAMGVKPDDLVGIVQSIHAAGAIKADIRFM